MKLQSSVSWNMALKNCIKHIHPIVFSVGILRCNTGVAFKVLSLCHKQFQILIAV